MGKLICRIISLPKFAEKGGHPFERCLMLCFFSKTECDRTCYDNQDCAYWTYDPSEQTCLQLGSCDEVACPRKLSGHQRLVVIWPWWPRWSRGREPTQPSERGREGSPGENSCHHVLAGSAGREEFNPRVIRYTPLQSSYLRLSGTGRLLARLEGRLGFGFSNQFV